jgi:hypothetical protein
MPALFAYVIAIGLLLGGGYSALSWLAAPEPAKVVTKAKQKPSPRYDAGSQESYPAKAMASSSEASSTANSSEAGSSGVDRGDAATVGSSDQPSSPPASASALDRSLAGSAEATPAEAGQEIRQRAATAPSPKTAQITPSTAVATAAKPQPPSHLRQTSRRSKKAAERPALVLMRLRTIEFPDGRRVTQLIPYRSGERALAFQLDQ